MSKHRVGGNANGKQEVKKEMVLVLRNGKQRLMPKEEYEATKPKGA